MVVVDGGASYYYKSKDNQHHAIGTTGLSVESCLTAGNSLEHQKNTYHLCMQLVLQ